MAYHPNQLRQSEILPDCLLTTDDNHRETIEDYRQAGFNPEEFEAKIEKEKIRKAA